MNKTEPILIACEESGIVTEEFIKLGFTNVFSCDLMETSGNYPDHHICGDVIPLINGNCCFTTSDGVDHEIKTRFSLIIAFPPCTHLAVSGAAWFEQKRKDGRQQQGIDFFMKFTSLDCPRVAIENPVGIMSTYYRKPDLIIYPWQYGHAEQKATCLWLKGLPALTPTNNVKEKMLGLPKNKRERLHYLPPGPDRAKIRSKTYLGIARAMAEQWAGIVKEDNK